MTIASHCFPTTPPLKPGRSSFTSAGELDLIQEIEARRRRSKFLPNQLFAEPGWDMLLYLALRTIQQRRVSMGELVAASGAPVSTGRRHLIAMAESGMISIKDDPLDARRKFVSIQPETFYKISLAIGCSEA